MISAQTRLGEISSDAYVLGAIRLASFQWEMSPVDIVNGLFESFAEKVYEEAAVAFKEHVPSGAGHQSRKASSS